MEYSGTEVEVWVPTLVDCLLFALTLVPSGELPLYRSRRGRWAAKWGCECTGRLGGRLWLFLFFLKGCFEDISASLAGICIKDATFSLSSWSRKGFKVEHVMFVMSEGTNSCNSQDCWYYPCLGQSRLWQLEWLIERVVLNLRWWRHLQLTEFSPTRPMSSYVVSGACGTSPNEKIWPSWHGVTTKHYRLLPVTNGRTTQLIASSTCSFNLGGGTKT